jgi:signal transduction histidine kinase
LQVSPRTCVVSSLCNGYTGYVDLSDEYERVPPRGFRTLAFYENAMSAAGWDMGDRVVEAVRSEGALPPRMVAERKCAELIASAAGRAGRMIEDLLREIAIDSGTLALSIRPEDPRALVLEVLGMFEPYALENRISLTAQIPGGLPAVGSDHDNVLRVFGNLMGNARKYTPPNGTITLSAQAAGAAVRFSVSDSGPGVEAGLLPHLFERGFHGARFGRGLGLGLAIAKGIVEAHGGEIGVESQVGRGSTFWFTLLVAHGDAAPRVFAEAAGTPATAADAFKRGVPGLGS